MKFIPAIEWSFRSLLVYPSPLSHPVPTPFFSPWNFLKVYLVILEREEGKRETDIDLLFHLFMHSLVDSCRCPDQPGMELGTLACWDIILINRATGQGFSLEFVEGTGSFVL